MSTTPPTAALCRHCGHYRGSKPRGLCARCYHDPAIRFRYPHLDAGRDEEREPTAAEVEALVAEQMERLPPWWPRAHSRDEGEPEPAPKGAAIRVVSVPVAARPAVQRGRLFRHKYDAGEWCEALEGLGLMPDRRAGR